MASGKLVAPVAFSQPRDHAHLHIWLIPGSEAPCERHSWIALCLYVSTCLINKTQSQSRSQSASRGLPHTQIWALQCPQTKPLIHRDRVQWEPKRGQSGAERPIQAFWVKSCIKMPFYSDEATLSLPVFLKVTILPCWISLLLIQQPTVMMSQDSTFVILGLEIRGTGVENVTEDKNRTRLYWNLISHAYFPRNSNHSEKERKGKESPMQQGWI